MSYHPNGYGQQPPMQPQYGYGPVTSYTPNSYGQSSVPSYGSHDNRFNPYGNAPSSSSNSYSSRDRGGGGRDRDRRGGGGRDRDRGYGGRDRDRGSRGGGYRGGGRGGGYGGRSSYKGKNEFGISFGQPGANLKVIDWTRLRLPPFQKNFYREASSVQQRTDQEIKKWRDDKTISLIGDQIPKPIFTFEEAGFPDYIMLEIKKSGFKAPTSIQSQGWPMSMSGRDVVGIAQTGSGKTLAFILPSILHINAQPLLRPGDGPIVLVIAPTRELAIQIDQETSRFASSSKIKHTCVYGGVSRKDQARQLKDGVEICICTPGRLLDFLESGTTNLRRVTYLVIDEADRLLDMGFEPQLKAIFSQVRPDRQILMWSATWPKEVRALAQSWTKTDTIQVSVGSFDTSANKNVLQKVILLEQYQKQQKLYELLREQWIDKTNNGQTPKILVFVATKRMCDELCRNLSKDQWPVTSIHGDKQQFERDRALGDFKCGKLPIMLATDVASRGIHVDDITHVINYDFPGNCEDYVHRIGRTGRAGKKGTAITLFTSADSKRAGKLIKILEQAGQKIPPELQKYQIQYQMENKWKYKHRSISGNNDDPRDHVKYRTVICRNWKMGTCSYGDRCSFAHGDKEIGTLPTFDTQGKMSICYSFKKGHCSYGATCKFKHEKQDVIQSQGRRRPVIESLVPSILTGVPREKPRQRSRSRYRSYSRSRSRSKSRSYSRSKSRSYSGKRSISRSRSR